MAQCAASQVTMLASPPRSPPVRPPKPLRLGSSSFNDSVHCQRNDFFSPLAPENTASLPIGVTRRLTNITNVKNAVGFAASLRRASSRVLPGVGNASKKTESSGLCSDCDQFPFTKLKGEEVESPIGSQDSSELAPFFTKPIEKILEKRNMCRFCGLVFKSLCQRNLDPLLHPVIQDFIQDELKNDTFMSWAQKHHKPYKKFIPGEGNWPFGAAKDQKEASKAAVQKILEELKENANADDFDSVENYDPGASLGEAVQGVSAGLQIMDATGMNKGLSADEQKSLRVATQATQKLDTVWRVSKTKLTMWVIGVGRVGSSRITIRTFAHGRAPRAPMKQLAQFKLLFESGRPRDEDGQLRYANLLAPTIDFDFFRNNCLRRCRDHHRDSCENPPHLRALLADKRGRIRLIYVKEMRLVEFELAKLNDKDYYAALSYRWGGEDQSKMPVRLTRANYYDFYEPRGINRDDLPATITDALFVTERFGLNYLWVDRLCLIQDASLSGGEYSGSEYSDMGRIYSQASFTIVAGDAEHDNHGLRGVGSSSRVEDDERKKTREALVSDEIVREVRGYLPLPLKEFLAPWESRAWTLQERLLSRRLLVFSKGFAVWHCAKSTHREDVNALDYDSPDALPFLKLRDDGKEKYIAQMQEDGSTRVCRPVAMQQYCDIVAGYTKRSLTRPEDILCAFEGLQSILEQTRFLGAFKYGLPIRFMDISLMWIPRQPLQRRDGSCFKGERRCPPSWSWAGWEALTEPVHWKSRVAVTNHTKPTGPTVNYERPYTVRTDKTGAILHRYDETNDEKLIPSVRFHAKSTTTHRLEELTTLGSYYAGTERTRGITTGSLVIDDRHLVFQTKKVLLRLGEHVSRIEKLIDTERISGQPRHIRTVQISLVGDRGRGVLKHVLSDVQRFFNFDVNNSKEAAAEGRLVAHERLLYLQDDRNQSRAVGTTVMNEEVSPRDSLVQAIILSEGRFFGTEKRVDVEGYPLYNIMLVKQEGGISYRVGLGKIYKYAFNQSQPREEIIVLG